MTRRNAKRNDEGRSRTSARSQIDSLSIASHPVIRLRPSPRLPPAPGGTYNRRNHGHHRNRRTGEVLPGLPEAGGARRPRSAGCSAASIARSRRSAASICTVEQGEFVAFLGPNGAGKTTTLKLLSGVITPTGGTARVMGYVPWQRENAYRRRFALVMGQKNQLWWDLPAAESFRLHQQIYRIEPRAVRAHAATN